MEIQFPYELRAELIRRELDQYQLKLVLFNVAADDLLQDGEGLAAVPENNNSLSKPLLKQSLMQKC